MLQEAFSRRTCVNSFPLHMATPLAEVEVELYSESRVALTGLIESPDALEAVARNFLHALAWFLAKETASMKDTDEVKV
jgi:hypothetical protein